MQLHDPIAPKFGAKLTDAIAALDLLDSQTEHLATSALKNSGARQKLSAHLKHVGEVQTSIAELKLLLRAAEKRDALQAAEQRHLDRLASLGTFEAATAAKNDAAADLCRGVEIAQKAYTAIIAASHRMANSVPPGTAIPRGSDTLSGEAMIHGRAFPASLPMLVAGEMWRHTKISHAISIDEMGAMPGARAISQEVIFDPAATEPLHVSTARVNAFLLDALRQQIEATHRVEIERIEATHV